MLSTQRAVVLFWVCILVVLALGTSAAAGAEYEIEMDESVETPDRTISHEGAEIEVNSLTVVQPGDELKATTNGPSNETYDVFLRDTGFGVEHWFETNIEGENDVSLSTEGYNPGSYAATVEGARIEDAQPVVIAAYDVDVSSPDNFQSTEDGALTVEVELSEHENAPIDSVEAVLWGNGDTERIELSEEGDFSYAVTTSEIDVGDYSLYVGVQSGDEIEGTDENELIGVSGTYQVVISSSDNGDDENGDTENGGTGDNGDSSDEEETSQGEDEVPDESDLEEDDKDSDEQTHTNDADNDAIEQNGTDNEADDGSEAPEDVINPSSDSGETSENVSDETDDRMPGFGLVITLSVIALAVSLRLRP